MEIDKKVKVIPTVKQLGNMARSLTVDIMEQLEGMIKSPDTPPATRLKAMEIVLDRGYGKAAPAIEAPPPDADAVEKAIKMLVQKAPHLVRKELAELAPQKLDIEDESEGS